jgi:hypothetical protein
MGARNGGQDRASGERSSRSLYHREHARTLLAGASRTIRNIGELGPINEVRLDAMTRLLSVSAESAEHKNNGALHLGHSVVSGPILTAVLV